MLMRKKNHEGIQFERYESVAARQDLLNAAEDDIELFGDDDFELFGTDDDGLEDTQLHDLVMKSAQNFCAAMQNDDTPIVAATGAFLLYQHLQDAGYKADLSVEDDCSKVTASACMGMDPSGLLAEVEGLLTEMVSMAQHFGSGGFTIAGLRSLVDEGTYFIEVHLIS